MSFPAPKPSSFAGISVAKLRTICLLVFVCTAFAGHAAAASQIDTTFNGGVTVQQGSIHFMHRQADGKILVIGGFTAVNGVTRYSIARLNADATLDTSFYPPDELVGTVRCIRPLPDGKYLIGGKFVIPLQTNLVHLARLNADGSYDTTFNRIDVGDQTGTAIYDIELAEPGKVFVAGRFDYAANQGGLRKNFARMNYDGTIDPTFVPAGVFAETRDIEVQADGKVVGVLTDGGGTNRFVKRFNPDGSEDLTFNALVTGTVNSVALQTDGRVLLGGDFTFVNNVGRTDVARLNTDGSLDTFSPTVSGNYLNSVEIDQVGRVLIGGRFISVNGVARNNIARLDPSGALDATFTSPLETDEFVGNVLTLPGGRLIISATLFSSGDGLVQLHESGDVEKRNPAIIGGYGAIYDTLVDSEGRVLVVGRFDAVNSLMVPSVARFNADGTSDETFDAPFDEAPYSSDPTLTINTIAFHGADKILVGGALRGEPDPHGLVRLNADGSLDQTFIRGLPAGSNIVTAIAVQADNGIIVAGSRTSLSQTFLRRLRPDGSLDSSFPSPTYSVGIDDIVIQPDGKIIVVGGFSSINGTPRGRIARLNPDGSLDNTFNPLGGASGAIRDVALQPDGKILIGGEFTTYNGTGRERIARVNPDGSLDGSFSASANNTVLSLLLEPTGKVVVGGTFTEVNSISRNRLTRLNMDGSLDTSFNIGSGTPGAIFTSALYPGNRIVIAGAFPKLNGLPKASIARLHSTAVRTPFDYDGDGITDFSVFRPSSGMWYLQRSTTGFRGLQFGANGDRLAPADYDGDGKTDIALYRPSTGQWYLLKSATNTVTFPVFGSAEDLPAPGDYDGDGKADLTVFRPSQGTWYRQNSSNGTFFGLQFGTSGDVPTVGDFDGDGKNDIGIFRPSIGDWYHLRSSGGAIFGERFGQTGDRITPADYDGDGKTDIAIFRPSTGLWVVRNSATATYAYSVFGSVNDVPISGDYDGDGKADIGVWRPSDGTWYVQRSSNGSFIVFPWGQNGDVPTPAAFGN